MPAPISISSYTTGHASPVNCTYKYFNNPTNLSSTVEMSSPAQCGYNINPFYYCNQYKGDPEYVSFVT